MQVIPLYVFLNIFLLDGENHVELKKSFARKVVLHSGLEPKRLYEFCHSYLTFVCIHIQIEQTFQVGLKLPQMVFFEEL